MVFQRPEIELVPVHTRVCIYKEKLSQLVPCPKNGVKMKEKTIEKKLILAIEDMGGIAP